MRFGAGLQIGNGFRPTRYWIENRTHRHADNEVRAIVVNAVDLEHPVFREGILNAEVELLDHRILDVVVDDIDAFGGPSSPGNDGTIEGRIRVRRSQAGNEVSVAIKEIRTAQADVDRQCAAVQSTLERFEFKRNAVVIDAVSAMQTGSPTLVREIEADSRAEVIRVLVARTVKEGRENRIDL